MFGILGSMFFYKRIASIKRESKGVIINPYRFTKLVIDWEFPGIIDFFFLFPLWVLHFLPIFRTKQY